LVHGRDNGSAHCGGKGCTRTGMPKTQAFGTWEEGEWGLGIPLRMAVTRAMMASPGLKCLGARHSGLWR